MKYYKSSKFIKAITSTGFLTIVACALIAVGAVTWFALSKNKAITEPPSSNNSSYPSYPDFDNSYNSEVKEPESNQQTHDVNEPVSDVPYVSDTSDVKDENENKITSETTESATDDTASKTEKPKFVLPVTGDISKGYSDSALQYSVTYGDMRLHTGLDILCEKGTEIKSATDGTIKSIVDDAHLGKVITIDHAYDFTVKYCGIDNTDVKEGDRVSAGDVIGTSGDIPSECGDKPHIHIEVLVNGKSISPLAALGLE